MFVMIKEESFKNLLGGQERGKLTVTKINLVSLWTNCTPLRSMTLIWMKHPHLQCVSLHKYGNSKYHKRFWQRGTGKLLSQSNDTMTVKNNGNNFEQDNFKCFPDQKKKILFGVGDQVFPVI